MHSKPIWWPALKAFNKRNVEETSSVSKVGLNDRFYLFIIISCFLGIRGQQSYKSSWKKKKKTDFLEPKALHSCRIMQATSLP